MPSTQLNVADALPLNWYEAFPHRMLFSILPPKYTPPGLLLQAIVQFSIEPLMAYMPPPNPLLKRVALFAMIQFFSSKAEPQ